MAMWAVCYIKGRHGATTTAAGLAFAAPPQALAVVVECDPAGGDLMRRHRLAAMPGLVGLATAARGDATTAQALAGSVQPWRIGDRTIDVVVAPSGGAQTRVALAVLARPGQNTLNPPDRLVIADCGRLDFTSPARPLLAMADAVLVLTRARADELAHLRERLADLVDVAAGRLTIVLAPGGVYPPADVADVVRGHLVRELARDGDDARVYGPLPDDRRAAAVLAGDLVAGRRWRRLPLMTALERLAGRLVPRPATAPRTPADRTAPRETSR
jgi:hypothetical protein